MAQGSAQTYGELLVFDQLPSLNAYVSMYRPIISRLSSSTRKWPRVLGRGHGEYHYPIVDPNNPGNVLKSFGRVNDPVHRGL